MLQFIKIIFIYYFIILLLIIIFIIFFTLENIKLLINIIRKLKLFILFYII